MTDRDHVLSPAKGVLIWLVFCIAMWSTLIALVVLW